MIVRKPVAVVFGARGLLGSALAERLPAAGWEVAAAAAHTDCDITDEGAVRALVVRARPDAVFNAAAYTDVDRAESEPATANAVNALGAENVARAAAAARAAVVHYSTDFVFDGELGRPYVETDTTSPRGRYASSKVAGDARVMASTTRHFILRVGCLYGHGGRNFPSTLMQRLRAGDTIRAHNDRLGSPTWVREVADVSAALARTTHHGLYHCTAQGETTWAEFARLMAELLGVRSELVRPVSTFELPLKAQRPRRAILDNRALRARGLDTLSRWHDGLRAFIAEETRSGE